MKHRLAAKLTALAFLVALATSWLVSGPLQLLASQGSNFLDTTGVYSGLTAANRTNAALDALLTCNSGSSAPTNALGGVPKLGQCWLDTTSASLVVKKEYTGSAWVVKGVIDVTNGIWVPVVGGGIGTVASSGTTDLCTSPQAVQNITGTTTITSFGSSCAVGQQKVVIFGGILTLTSGTPIKIPGGTKTTAANDAAIAAYLGSGNWQIINFIPAAGAAVTSISITPGTCISQSGSPVTTNGSITVNGTCFTVAATKSDQQTGTSNTVPVTPLHQQDHDSALKVNCAFEGRPTASLLGGYGCTGISRTSAGLYTITFSTAFANTTYNCTGTSIGASTVYFGTKATTTIVVNTVNLGSSAIGSDNTFDIQCAGRQ